MKLGLAMVGLLAIASLCWQGYAYQHQEKVAYVNVVEVFNGFDMKKEAQSEFEKVSETRKLIIDSLKFDFNQRLDAGDTELERLRREIIFKEQQFQESDAAMVEKSNQEILTRLNLYMKEFGENHDYDLILGAQGSGSLIYAREDKDVTTEMLEYVNSKYQGME